MSDGTCEPLRGCYDDIPEPMRSALERVEPINPELAAESADAYREADDITRADILAFFESDGPERVRQVRLRHEEGVPTASDLAGWAGA